MSYVTARDANHRFSQVLRDAEAGKEVVITRNGKPVARIIPEPAATQKVITAEQEKAWQDTLAWALSDKPGVRRMTGVTREEIYAERISRFSGF